MFYRNLSFIIVINLEWQSTANHLLKNTFNFHIFSIYEKLNELLTFMQNQNLMKVWFFKMNFENFENEA